MEEGKEEEEGEEEEGEDGEEEKQCYFSDTLSSCLSVGASLPSLPHVGRNTHRGSSL